jgi:DNA-directed RNA polymerase beta' subunit
MEKVTTIAINPMIARNYNVDFDGDAMSLTNLQSEQARADFGKLFVANHIKLY